MPEQRANNIYEQFYGRSDTSRPKKNKFARTSKMREKADLPFFSHIGAVIFNESHIYIGHIEGLFLERNELYYNR